jgi:excisionase family DNA binding protein
MPRTAFTALTVQEAARVLECAPQTVRRLLQTGRLSGHKHGREWIVWWADMDGAYRGRPSASQTALATTPAELRQRLRSVGAALITIGNQTTGTHPRRGQVFLTWRTSRSLQVTLAIGRTRLTQEWAPHALGTTLPFWVQERPRWRRVLPLLRRYECLRLWCHPRLLRIPDVVGVVQDELGQLEAALGALAQEALLPPSRQARGGPRT